MKSATALFIVLVSLFGVAGGIEYRELLARDADRAIGSAMVRAAAACPKRTSDIRLADDERGIFCTYTTRGGRIARQRVDFFSAIN